MNESKSGGIGFTGAIQIVFIVLKLLGKIHWSWLWVLSPIWICILVCILALMFYLFIK